MNFLFNGELIDYDFFRVDENDTKAEDEIKNNSFQNINNETIKSKSTENENVKNKSFQKRKNENIFNNLTQNEKQNFENSVLQTPLNSKIDAIVFLHGWGGNKNSFKSTINLLKHKFNILAVTMPTIANTAVAWNLIDYSNLILALCKLHGVNSIYIVCHSCGFRVAHILKQQIEIKKIVVTGGAGLKKFSIFKRLETNNNKILLRQVRFKFLFNSVASADYIALSPTNKKTFSAVVGMAFNNFCKFNCPMLLFWGKRDSETKIWIAKKLQQENDAKLIVSNSDHFAYLKENARFNNAVLNFL